MNSRTNATRHWRRTGRRGLTLMELVIVLVILVALAGVVIPLFPDMILRGHTSAGSTNITEIAKAVQLYANMYGTFPDRMDSLTTTTGLASYLPVGTAGDLASGNLQSSDLSALNASGITTIAQMMEDPGAGTGGTSTWNPTFFPYGNDNTVSPTTLLNTLSTSSSTVFLSSIAAQREFGQLQTDNGRFVVFGLGSFTSMLGKTLTEAPVFFNSTQNADKAYSRFGLVFQTADVTGALARARFIGVIQMTSTGVKNANDNINFFYTLQ
jgi:prepilin-type N-terminal cleavage/methylation domain-containing protein